MINEPNSAEPRLRVRVTPFVHAAIVLCIVISAHDFPLVLLLLRLPMPSTTVSKARILGNAELFIKSGNDINLTCTTSQDSSPPSFIYWYKGGRVVNYSQRGGINVSTDRTTKTSNLIISRASPADSGNYTCAPSNSGKLIIEIAQFGLACSDSDLLLTLLSRPIRCRLRDGACDKQHWRGRHEARQQQRNESRLCIVPLPLLVQHVALGVEMSYHINVNK
jgi:Immunoglobulin domain